MLQSITDVAEELGAKIGIKHKKINISDSRVSLHISMFIFSIELWFLLCIGVYIFSQLLLLDLCVRVSCYSFIYGCWKLDFFL